MAQVHPEKHNYQYELQLPILARVKVQRTNAQLIIICILTFLCCAFLLFLKPLSQSDLPPNPGFPSRPPVSLLRPAGPHLNWIPCSCPRFQCANLSVPLDYPNPNETRTASVALVRYLASNPSTETGTLIFNPGGPGGSGTGSTYRLGPLLDEILGGRYDVLGFDPRDINMPLPRVTCLQNEGTLWQMLATTAPSLHLHDVGIWDAVAQLMAEGYEADVLPFVNTPTVARDIAAIVDALHAERRHRVSYWGFSYGTNLGAIFVAMFPNKLHKIILDGIRSPFDAREVYKWGYTSLASLNDVVDGYFSICEEVGKAQCPLATGHVGGAKQKVMDFLLSLYKRPLPVYDQGRAGLVTFSAYKSFLYGTLYRPASWRLFAQATAHLLAGNGTSFFAATGTAVLCTDAIPATNYTLASWTEYVANMSARSFVAGDSRALATLPCRHWAAEPNERWEGDFASVRLNLPVLLIGNRYDPETPLDSARRLAEEMGPNAALVEQRSYGHCSISAVSSCTFGVVLHYLLDGIVPDVGKVCEVDDVDYGDYFPREGRALSLSKYTRLAEMVVEELGEQL